MSPNSSCDNLTIKKYEYLCDPGVPKVTEQSIQYPFIKFLKIENVQRILSTYIFIFISFF